MKKLSIAEINKNLQNLVGWELFGEEITKTSEFKSFKQSMELVNKVASLAEKLNHHPDIKIEWNKVTLNLSTHSENGLTQKDFELAEQINNL